MRAPVWINTKEDLPFEAWNAWLCLRADFTARLWPTNRYLLWEEGLSIDEAMKRTYPDWEPE